MRTLLLAWIAAALWLVPATVVHRVPGHHGPVVTVDEGTLLTARLPERLELTWRGLGGATPLATAAVHPPAPARAEPLPAIARWRAAAGALRRTARRHPLPRRAAFRYEATAPPAAR